MRPGSKGAHPPAPRVSVICIFYNEAKYIREAVASVLAQDFEDFELLLVDDGSSDESSRIARGYAALDTGKIRYLEHPGHANRGMSAARNLGLREAKGALVGFIDADDRWRRSKLTEQVALLDRMPEVDAVTGAVNYWASHDGGTDRIVRTGSVGNRSFGPSEASLRLYPLGRAPAPSMSDLLFRKSSILAIGGFEEAFRGAYEDQAFLAKFYLQSSFHVADSVWSDYRLHPSSCMARIGRNGGYDHARKFFFLWFRRYLAGTRHSSDPRIVDAVERALQRTEQGSGTGLRAALRRRSPALLVSAVRRSRAQWHSLQPVLAPGPAILMYHRIAEETFDPWGLAVSPANFAGQLEWIAANRTPLPLPEFAERHLQGTLPRNAVAVTFDDGYACNAQAGVPLLRRHAIPATIFLPAELIERGREFWWDELERILLTHPEQAIRIDDQQVCLGDLWPDDRNWRFGDSAGTPRQLAYQRLWSLLSERTPQQLAIAVEQLRDQAGTSAKPRDSHRPLTPLEIRTIGSDLVQFGSHTLNHASLPLLTVEEKAREITRSMERCAELTGERPRSFAYPYGHLDPETKRLVERAGYLCACKAEGSFVKRKADAFTLPRIFMGNWDSDHLQRRLGRPGKGTH